MDHAHGAPDGLPILLFADQSAWGVWLAAEHTAALGVWLRLAKRGAALQSLTYSEALDVALCYGWIDSHKRTYDAESWIQRFTPRRARSVWSKVNRDKVLALIANGQMQPAGLRAVELAEADGRWAAAYDAQSVAVVPADLQAALDSNAQANAFFVTLNSQNRYAILHRIQTVKKPETRTRRIAEFVAMLERHELIYP